MKIKLPKSFVPILAAKVKFKQADLSDIKCLGEFDTWDKYIHVEIDLSSQRKKEVFFHELLEYILVNQGHSIDKPSRERFFMFSYSELSVITDMLLQALEGAD